MSDSLISATRSQMTLRYLVRLLNNVRGPSLYRELMLLCNSGWGRCHIHQMRVLGEFLRVEGRGRWNHHLRFLVLCLFFSRLIKNSLCCVISCRLDVWVLSVSRGPWKVELCRVKGSLGGFRMVFSASEFLGLGHSVFFSKLWFVLWLRVVITGALHKYLLRNL